MNTRMQKLLLSTLFLSLCASMGLAQSSADYNKVEFYGGYSRAELPSNIKTVIIDGSPIAPCTSDGANTLGKNFQNFFCKRRGFNGFDTSITYNFTRYFGIKGNVTGHYKSDRFVDTFGAVTDTINSKERLYNFLAGVQVKDNGKAGRFKPNRKVDIRLVEFDYNPIFTGDYNTTGAPFSISQKGKTAHNFTIGAGIVIH